MKLLKYMYTSYKENDFAYLSAQTSYFLLLSFIPFLVFIFTIVGNFDLPTEEIYTYLKSVLPSQSYTTVAFILSEVLSAEPINIMSLLFALYFASKGVRALIVALNKAYCEDECRKVFHLYSISLVFTLLFVLTLVLMLFSLVFGKVIGEMFFDFLGVHSDFNVIWVYIRYIITILFSIVTFSFIYKYAPSCTSYKLKFKDVIGGAVFTTISWTISSTLFAYYVNNYNNSYSALYGSLGGFFALLVWLYLSSTIIILGGEVNSYFFNH